MLGATHRLRAIQGFLVPRTANRRTFVSVLKSCSAFFFFWQTYCRDKLGIIERVGKLAAANGVSIRAILQNDAKDPANVNFVVTTDPCK